MLTWLSLLASLFQAQVAPAEPISPDPALLPSRPVVVELFTSQGCPMCPSANQLLAEYGAQSDVIALAWGVSYWDAYGWTDQYAQAEFVDRQKAYVDAGEARRVYTPQFVINGAPELLRFDRERIERAMTAAQPVPLAQIQSTDAEASLRLEGEARSVPADVWSACYQPGIETRMIESGRNAGMEMTHFNMVRQLTHLGEWMGGSLSMDLPDVPEGLACVVLVQDGPGGVILSANRF